MQTSRTARIQNSSVFQIFQASEKRYQLPNKTKTKFIDLMQIKKSQTQNPQKTMRRRSD